MSYLVGAADLGDDASGAYLNHALVPFLGRTVYLRLVNTMAKALAYAAGGFHVSVSRGLGGGCKDDVATDTVWRQSAVTRATACRLPLGRSDLRALWDTAAHAYYSAYLAGKQGKSLAAVKALLEQANNSVGGAYYAEGVEPPRDPATGTVEPQTASMLQPWMLMAAGAGVIMILGKRVKLGQAFGGKGKGKGRKRRPAPRRAAARRRRR